VYSAKTNLGGGVILELSHEVDYTSYLLNGIRNIKSRFGRMGKNVTIDAEDYVDLLIEGERGPANLHMNFLSQINQREIQVDFEEISIKGDLIDSAIKEYKNGKVINERCFNSGYNISYIKQLDYFFSNIDNPRMMNNLFESIEVFQKLLEIKKEK
jgi:predicted dehydrogenase